MSIEKKPEPQSYQLVPGESCVKFDPDGQTKYFPGVTILSHFYQGLPIYDEMIKICVEADRKDQIKHYVKLPGPSLHMTLCDIKVYDPLPGPLAVDEIRNRDVAKFTNSFHKLQAEIGHSLPIKMKADLSPDRYPKEGRTLNVPLTPLNAVEERKLNHIREKLLTATGRLFNPDYKFHITLYYALGLPPNEEFSNLTEFWAAAMRRIDQAIGVIAIDRLELCTFDTMFHFKVVAVAEAQQ